MQSFFLLHVPAESELNQTKENAYQLPNVISMKVRWQESLTGWEKTTDFGHNSNIKIRPANFSTEHKNMLANLHAVVTKQYLVIPERYDKLITSLRTAWATELSLDKKQTSYDGLIDALRLGLLGYKFE